MSARIELRLADITTQEVDAIVNAANSRLAHGGGVAAAIARAAGPTLVKESEDAPNVPTGQAHVTTAGNLPSRFVIHAVGPVWKGGESGEPEQLASAYRRCVEIADSLRCRSLAMPSVSTGIFGFPLELAAPIALATVAAALEHCNSLKLARFCLFTQDDLERFRSASVGLGLACELPPTPG